MTAKKKQNSKDETKAKDFIDLAFSLHEDDWIKTADRLNKAVKGQWANGFNRRGRVVINEAFSLVNLILPHFIFQNPYITVTANNAKWLKKVREGVYKQTDAAKMSRNMQAVINNHIEKIGQVFEDRKAIQDALIFPFGVTKDGYSFETISEKDNDYIVKDIGFHKRVNPRDFGWHPMATGVDDSPWLVHRVVLTKEVCEDREIDVSELEPGIPEHLRESISTKYKRTNKTDFDCYTFYEVHHQDRDMIYLFGGENKILIDKKEKKNGFTGSDFNILTFTKDNDDFMGIPMLAMVEPQFWLLNEVLSLMVEHLRKFPGQVFANKDSLDEDQKSKILTGVQGSLHTVNDINGLLRTTPLQMGQEYFQIFNLIVGIIDRTLGIPDFQRLTSNTSRISATAASFIQGDSTVRKNYFSSIVKEFVLNGIKKQAILKQLHQDEKEFIQATGELQNEIFEVNKEDYPGDYLFNFDIDSLRAVNEAGFNNLNNLMTIMSNNPTLQPVLSSLDPFKTGKKFFSLASINYESLTKDGIQEGIIYTPEKENQIAENHQRTGVLMPRPNRNEDIEHHLETHEKFLEEVIARIGNNELAIKDPVVEMLIEHIAETRMIADPSIKPQQMPVQPEVTQPDIMAPAGPSGPMTELPQ